MNHIQAREHDIELATDHQHKVGITVPFGRRAAALGGLAIPVALLVDGLASALLQQESVANTTCCPLL